MQNRGTISTLIVIVLVLIAGYWLFNTPRGVAFRHNLNARSQAAVYQANNYDPTPTYRADNTLVPVNSPATAYGPKGYPTSYPTRMMGGQMAYVTYPIAKSSSSSGTSVYYPPTSSSSSSSSSSSYYVAPNPNYNYYPGGNSGGCYVGGCSNQICSDQPAAMSTCEYREQYSCYQSARCERQASGQCGWTMTDELYSCLGAR